MRNVVELKHKKPAKDFGLVLTEVLLANCSPYSLMTNLIFENMILNSFSTLLCLWHQGVCLHHKTFIISPPIIQSYVHSDLDLSAAPQSFDHT